MQNGAIIYKCENPINGCCSKCIKPTKRTAQARKRIQNVKPSMGAVKYAQKQ